MPNISVCAGQAPPGSRLRPARPHSCPSSSTASRRNGALTLQQLHSMAQMCTGLLGCRLLCSVLRRLGHYLPGAAIVPRQPPSQHLPPAPQADVLDCMVVGTQICDWRSDTYIRFSSTALLLASLS